MRGRLCLIQNTAAARLKRRLERDLCEMFANLPVSCNWQLQGTASPGDTAAATYAPAPGTRQPCEIAIRLWELEQQVLGRVLRRIHSPAVSVLYISACSTQGGATSVRVTSSARTYELYAKIHSNANGSYVASFRGKETERPGVFSVKIPLQVSVQVGCLHISASCIS